MAWVLVFISIISGKAYSEIVGTYDSMYECFEVREYWAKQMGGFDGKYPLGKQGICVRTDVKDL
jgi:hypothetical protein